MSNTQLRTVRSTDPAEVRTALAALAQELLPKPPLPSNDFDRSEVQYDPKVLAELRENLFATLEISGKEELTEHRRGAAVDLVSRSLSVAILKGKESEVRSRLGEKGLLSSSQYRVEFTESFRTVGEKLGVRRSHVEELIRNPHAVQHIRLRQAKDSPSFSVFTKEFPSISRTGPFTLLAVPRRVGDVQYISDVFRVYHEDVRIPPGSTPLDVLRAFVEKYGCDIQVGGSRVSRLIIDEVVPIGENATVVGFVGPLPNKIEAKISSILRVSDLGVVEVALAFAINVTLYRNSLIERGVT